MNALQARILITLLSFVAVVLAVAALRLTYIVSMPLVAAFFIAVLVWPVEVWLRARLPERVGWLSVVLTMLGVVIVLAGFVAGVATVLYRVTSDRAEDLFEAWGDRWDRMMGWLEDRGLAQGDGGGGGEPIALIGEWAGGTVSSLLGFSAVMVLIVFFTLLMLVEARHWKGKSRTALHENLASEVMATVSGITRQVRTFLLVQAFVASVTAVVTGIWLWAMGVPYALLWSLLTFIVDFVPNAGPTLAGVLISLVALLTLGWERALLTSVGILGIQQFFGHFIDPVLKGRGMSMSALVVLLSVAFWAWVWGPAGAVLGVPITASLMVIGAHVPALRPLAYMLSRTDDPGTFEEQTRGE